jgi:PAS domain S-box-containing protein
MLDGLGAISDTLAQFVERSRNARAMRMLKYSTDSANEAMFTINAEGRIVDVNQTACRRLEYSREELLAMSVPDINPRVSSRRWTEIWEEVRDRRELVFEAEHRTKSGRIIPVEVSKYFVEFENEPFICDSVREITDRKLAENALRESAEKTRAILNSTTDGIITITESGIIEEFNKAGERLFGYSAEELRGRNVSMLMPSPYRQEHDQYIARYLQTGERKIIGIGREVMGVRKDGTTFPLEDRRIGYAALGAGFVVRAIDESGMIPRRAVQRIAELAALRGIPMQVGVTAGGNDGSRFVTAGAINIPLSWPLRYAHTAAEVADLRDIEALLRITTALLEQELSAAATN